MTDRLRQVKEARATTLSKLSEIRDKINSSLKKTEQTADQYFQRVEDLVKEQCERLGRAVPKQSVVDFDMRVDELHRQVAELATSYLHCKAVREDAKKAGQWHLEEAKETADKF